MRGDEQLPYLTADIPGTGGAIKALAADFQVTEIPLYQPCGSGEHTYVQVEKSGITTLEAIRRLAKALGLPEREVGYAGMKDSRGITRQTLSLPRVAPERLQGLSLPGIAILAMDRHTNKLRLGHLAGNRFLIRVRQVTEDGLERCREVLAVLGRRGCPNFFGEQRYGSQGNSHLIGRHLLRGELREAVTALMGDPDKVRDERWRQAIALFRQGELAGSMEAFPGHCRVEREVVASLVKRPDDWQRAVGRIPPKLVRLYLSAWQSHLFDRLLARRLDGFDRVMAGDLAFKHANGACFLVEDPAAEAPRATALEISPSGPLFGSKVTLPQGIPLEMELAILADEGLVPADLAAAAPFRLEGERRPLRIPIRDAAADRDGDDLLLEFTLPRGAYATTVLREIMKPEAVDAAGFAATIDGGTGN